MIPKLTDDAVAELPLGAGRAELLEEIMTTVAPDRPAEQTPVRQRSRWLVPLAVAAAVAAVASTPLWWGGGQGGSGDGSRDPSVSYQPAAQSPGTGYRAVLTAPGWQVDHVEGDSKYGGEVGYRNGAMSLQVTWYPEGSYESYVEDREHITDPPAPGEPVTVLGKPGQMWAYSATDHAVIREPDQEHWMEIRADGMDKAAYVALLGKLRLVSLAEFEATLPSDFATAAERPAAVRAILDDIEGVTGVTVPAGTTLDTDSDAVRPLPAGRRHRRSVRLLVDRRVRRGEVRRRPGPGRRGRPGPRHLAPVAGAPGDGRRRRLPRGGLAVRRPGGAGRCPSGTSTGWAARRRPPQLLDPASSGLLAAVSGTASSWRTSRTSVRSISRCSVGDRVTTVTPVRQRGCCPPGAW